MGSKAQKSENSPHNGANGPNEQKGSLLLAWQVSGKHCLVIGAGDVALSRIHHLIIAKAKITVITGKSRIHPEILQLHSAGKIHQLCDRDYQISDLSMYGSNHKPVDTNLDELSESDFEKIDDYLHQNRFEVVCCCIDDHVLSTKIYYQCKLLGINANIADKPKLCDFYFGSMINKDNLQIMVSTNGKSPRLSKLIKDNIKRNLDGDINRAIENLNLVRFTLRDAILKEEDVNTIELRMSWIKELTDFYSIKQWGDFDINEGNVMKIVNFYPQFPPKNLDEFIKILRI